MMVSRQTASLWAAQTRLWTISPPASASMPCSLSGPAAFRSAIPPLGSLTACLPLAASPVLNKHRNVTCVFWAAAGDAHNPTPLPVAIVQGRRQGQGPQRPFPTQRLWEQGRGGTGAVAGAMAA